MLAAWIRMKYPSAVDGAIAGSAPILAFPGTKGYTDGERYWHVETRAATPFGGAASACSDNMRQAWRDFFSLARSPAGRAQLTSIFRVCKQLEDNHDIEKLAMFLLDNWDSMTMGNF